MKKRKAIILAVVGVIVLAIIGASGFKWYLEKNLEKLADSSIADISLSSIADGSYTGSFKAFPVAAEVKVTVKDHLITEVALLKHENGQGTAAEVIPSRVAEAQTLKVDIVAGATYSSKAILKAIENALARAGK